MLGYQAEQAGWLSSGQGVGLPLVGLGVGGPVTGLEAARVGQVVFTVWLVLAGC